MRGKITFRNLKPPTGDNANDIMRQNVYLIELLRELLDEKEPRYEKRRWYDHGWR
jgi:hypothetical protein